MSKSAVDHMEVRWRVTGTQAWSAPRKYPPAAEVSVDGLERNKQYDFEARNVSACGATSVWVASNYTVPPPPVGTLTLVVMQQGINDASGSAAAANAELANIASDNVLSSAEKPTVIRDYSVLTTEQAGIDAQATQYGATTEKSDYDNAISTLTAYLNGLNTPVPWNNKSGDTTITGSTFRSYFNNVYTARQALLNTIYQTAKSLADGAQSTASTANTTANTANANTPAVANPQFVLGLAGWSPDGAGWTAASTGSPNPQITTCAQFYSGATNAGLYNNIGNPCQPDDRFTATGQIDGNSGTGNAYVGIAWFNASKQLIISSFGNPITGNATGTSRVVGTAPAGAVYCEAVCAVLGYTTGGGGGLYAFTGITLAPQPNSLDETPDGLTRFGAAEPGADKTAGKDLSLLAGRTADKLSYTAGGTVDSLRPTEAGAEKTAGKPIDVLADGTLFRRTGAGYVDSSGRVVTLWDGTTVRQGSDIGSATSRALSGFDSAGSLVQDKTPLSRLGSRTLDVINDSSTRFAAVEGGADRTSSHAASGDNLAVNPGFEQNHTGTVDGGLLPTAGGPVCDGWSVEAYTSNIQVYWYGGASRVAGGHGVLLRGAAGQVLPTGAWYGATIDGTPVGANPDDMISVGGWVAGANSAGVGYLQRVGVKFFDRNGGVLSQSYIDVGVGGWRAVGPWNYPAPAGTAGVAIFIGMYFNAGSTAVTFADSSTFGEFDDMHLTRNDARVPGSGIRLGDQGNAPASLTSSLGMVRSATALTASSTGAVNVNAHSVTYGPRVVSYHAVTNAVTGLAQGSSYYIYCRDNGLGGSPTWLATTSAQTANGYDDGYNAGYVTIPTSGSSGGGGGLGSCVCADMWVWPVLMGLRGALTARELARRWRWWKPWLWFLRGPDGWHLVRRRPRIVQEHCVRPIVADGSHVDCSDSTPVTTQSGESILTPHLLGRSLATDSGWQRVTDVELLPGLRDVVRICVGGHSFFASADRHHYLSTHNSWKP